MINNHMDSKNTENENAEIQEAETKPNESTGIYVRGFVKITDPESGKVIVETAK